MKKLLLTVAAGMLTAAAASAETVYFDNTETNWSPVNAYVWEPNNTWPGEVTTEVTVDGHKLCKFEITEGQTNVIFNNGNGQQTGDLKVVDNGVYNSTSTTPIAMIVDGKYQTDDLPEIPTEPSVVYLRGDMNAWGTGEEWQFTTTDNDTYVLAGVSVSATQNWKIADADWNPVNFGGATNIALNTTVQLAAGSNTNCNLAAGGEDLTFTFVLSTGMLTVTGEAGEEPEQPITPPAGDYKDLYLVGAATGWDLDESYKFDRNDNVYTLTLADGLSGEWKIWDGTWAYNFGAGLQPEIGVLADCYFDGANFDVPTTGNTVITFTLIAGSDVANSSIASTILIQGEAGEPDEPIVTPTEPKELYIVGEVTDWSVSEEYKMTREGNVYTYTFPTGITGEWKIFDGTWDYTFGAGADQPSDQVAVDVWFGSSSNFTFNSTNPFTATFTLVEGSDAVSSSIPSTLLVKVDNTGIADVEADAVEARYFNLQGVEVAAPAQGIFIEVRGNAARKVIR